MSRAAEPPPLPVGLDAYRHWADWPRLRTGMRTYMRSTYDRRGGNEGADASHFLYQLADDHNVTLDVTGPGILCFARYNHWHGSPWHYVVDGVHHLVQESSSPDPARPVAGSVFIPELLFPKPLAWTWSDTKGADLSWVPVPFEKSFRMAYSRTRYGTGYYIYQQFLPGLPLSRPIQAWDGKTPPAQEVLELISRAGTDIAPAEGEARTQKATGKIPSLGGMETILLKHLTTGEPSGLRALELSVPRGQEVAFGRARLRVTWDDQEHASIEAPVALFFGAGTLYNRDNREYLVKAFPVHVRFDEQRVNLGCYFPMPFSHSARIELTGNGVENIAGISWSVRWQPLPDPVTRSGYFHATWRDHPTPVRGEDLVLLDTRGVEGGGDWSGHLVGTSFIFSKRAVLTTLEGDPRFFFDDSQSPQAQGTGTEEWGGGGDYWGGRNMTLPFAGHPTGAPGIKESQNDEDRIQSAYRFLLGDLMPFGKNAMIRLEHGGLNESTEHYQTLTYWYGRRGATLVKTDELKIGDPESETAHRYSSPGASAPYEIVSRYEWGPDSYTEDNNRPLADPVDSAQFGFEAEAGRTFHLWVRGRNVDGRHTSDAFWMQFDEDIGTSHMAASYRHPKGFGNWLDQFPAGTFAWSGALPQAAPRTITFARSGKHRLLIQPRHPGHQLEQIWLSVSQTSLPGPEQRVPAAGPGEIVLTAGDAVQLKGGIRFNKEGVLEINGQPPPPPVTEEVYPAHKEAGRKMTGTSEFTMKLHPDHLGVMLRRKLDYQFPNQRAEVFVADETGGDWRPAGVWYLAGSNTCVYSNPPGELGKTVHEVQTSNRRFRDDEFLLPRALTIGRSAVRVRIKFSPVNLPLFPGHPPDEQAWSEIRYDAWCFLAE